MEFNFEVFIYQLPLWGFIVLSSFTAFLVTYVSIPAIADASKHLNVFEPKSSRGSHHGDVPTLGGVAIFIGIVISGTLFLPINIIEDYRYLFAALLILFVFGVRDDLLVLKPKNKFYIELLVALIATILGDIRITSFQGFLGVEEIPYLASVPFSVFVYIVIINGFNLIDGIDGLASGIAILVSLAFGALFLLNDDKSYAYAPFMLAGSLAAFFRFNVFSKKNKIFLGDTGSLTIGFLIATITITLLEQSSSGGVVHQLISVPALTIAILIVPLFDTLRVFILRILSGESPFQADRKHIHHRLLSMGYSHQKSTLLIMCSNLLIIGISLLFGALIGALNLLIVFIVAAGLSYIPIHIVDRRSIKMK